jgi:hypothetical protein
MPFLRLKDISNLPPDFLPHARRRAGAMSDYRASAQDIAQDLDDAAQQVLCPCFPLWGEDFSAVGRLFDMKAVWSEMAENLSAAPVGHRGHLPQECSIGFRQGKLPEERGCGP